jgi:F420-non-reducing hydrogenase large subunit
MGREKVITVHPVTRIEGHARISIHLDPDGNVATSQFQINSLRGFEKFIEGRPAEEIPRIVSRICGICPWMHHLAANKAVDKCFGVTPTPAGHALRELCQIMAHINDKILHFFFLAAPDFIIGPESDYSVRSVIGIARQAPELAAKVVKMRQLGQEMLRRFTGKAIHPVAAVVGGFSKPLPEEERRFLLDSAREQLDFASYALDFARNKVFAQFEDLFSTLGYITTGFLGTVDRDGALRLYDGQLRLMKPDGTYTDFPCEAYEKYLSEHVESWSFGKMPYAKSWKEGFSMDLAAPRGIYRVNSLARLNVCDHIATPRAQEALEEYREKFGRPVQATLLYHWARLIELVYACERTVEILERDDITSPAVRSESVEPAAGRGIGCVEAPRGTLIHDYTTDEDGCIVKANMIVGTTHNIAPMNMSVQQAAKSLIKNGIYDEALLNKVEMAVRAYDP